MIHQMNIYGKDKVEQAIERIKTFEPEEGYYLSFSGGKDSVTIKALADMAGVKYDAHYNVTSVDPPELVHFVKSFKDVSFDYPRYRSGEDKGKVITMWNLIPKSKLPPTRIARYCCANLKETQGEGRFVMTGVRWAESNKRAANRGGLEVSNYKTKKHELIDPDNPDQETIHFCMQHSKRILNPIIDWTTEEVWEFIHEYNIPYCKLYDEGFKRIGCIGCPISGAKGMLKEFERYPKYKNAYMRAFERMIEERKKAGRFLSEKDGTIQWDTAENVFKWWIEKS